MAPEVVDGVVFVPANEQNPNFPRTEPRSLDSLSRANTQRPISSPRMQPEVLGQIGTFSRDESGRPPRLRRRITIGGLGQDAKEVEQGTWRSGIKKHSNTFQGGDSKFPSVKSHYPPTSWRSTATVQFTTSNVGEYDLLERSSSSGLDGGFGRSNNNVGLGKVDLNPPSSTATMTSSLPQGPRSPEASINPAPQPLPVRSRSRRYSIIFSAPGTPENAATPQNRATGASAANRPASAGRTPLPDPETAYAHTYYYTVCAHTSPPMSRPLNVQPTLAQYRRGLLAYPPFHLRAYNPDQGTSSPMIYVLDGSCSDCDITMRRQAESKVLDRYTHELENLSIQLSLLQKDIALETCNVSFPDKSDDAITMFSFPSTLELEPEATQAIFEMEDRLDQLVRRRDHEVKQIWRGYTARWGPATVGIHREDNIRGRSRARTADTRDTISQEDTAGSTTSFGIFSDDRSPGRTRTMTTVSTQTTMPPSHLSRRSSYNTRSRASSVGGPQERYSDGTYDLSVDSSVDGVKGRGRMVVDWIRPGRREGRSRSMAQTSSRKSSWPGK
ncbi:uncharacterized protein Z519_03519 [Cladophialophora bantiana CBS 173.52]|uniref:Uncharacterized protein n=1 Tax=Cladophialophora bantiana (strain ATCC 10958 / CBS 173.52 / CDC B-1940 / NIH 8579) TaxID=1442370 RepID=A0A0D2HZX0_CLAB1|nr:uncharacterized protein Z519_03519 [Cladophialophora bantiana CBS 173.52]KIW96450.1 hypothetical protein Z519_03519 [Cladophialophora bantiana CBS 173.52]